MAERVRLATAAIDGSDDKLLTIEQVAACVQASRLLG